MFMDMQIFTDLFKILITFIIIFFAMLRNIGTHVIVARREEYLNVYEICFEYKDDRET